MRGRAKALIAGGAVVAVLLTGGIAALAVGAVPPGADPAVPGSAGSTPQPTESAVPTRSATEIGRAFLADYVESSGTDAGRVVRRDQGGDTVSEGQAYGMLVAAAVGDEKSFGSIWSWTKANLQRDDGLLAWRWENGAVVDDQPASDADVDAARALVLAGKTFDEPSYTAAAKRLSTRILDSLTASTPDGRILLPGLWAAGSGPWSYNPSYAAPATFALLATATGDPRWSQLVTGSRAVTTKLLDSSALPSDWAQVKTDGTVVPLPGATGTSGTVEYGYDAGRLPVRFAESCQAADVELAARTAPALDGKDPLSMELDLGGSPLNQDESPLAYVARASARAAAGDTDGARADLASADRVARAVPTYYGAAWDALGALSLQSDSLGGCSPLSKG